MLWDITLLTLHLKLYTVWTKWAHQRPNFKFRLLTWKLSRFLMSFFKPQVSFPLNFASSFSLEFCVTLASQLLTACMKINQIPAVVYQTTSQFSFKLCITLQYHDITPMSFFSWKIIWFGQKQTIKVQLLWLLSALMNVHPILNANFETTRS